MSFQNQSAFDATPAPAPAGPRYSSGDLIGGRFQVHKVLQGGMGEVYLCLDVEETLPYALKTFQHRHSFNPAALETFREELGTWVSLGGHPNIVRCFQLEVLDNQPFMLLEWVAGEEGRGTDLRNWLRNGPLNLQLALDFVIDICRGLVYANETQPGIVHRDLKPDNVLVDMGRTAKITDFGLALFVQQIDFASGGAGTASSSLQQTQHAGAGAGTPLYMPPEQWRGGAIDARADIYAVGCILYELLTNQFPYPATTMEELQRQHEQAPPPIVPAGSDIPPAINELLAGCMAKRPSDRFADASTLLDALTGFYKQHLGLEPISIEPMLAVSELGAVDYNNRSVTYHELGRYAEALADCNTALALDPNFAGAYLNRGRTLAQQERLNEALADFCRAIELDSGRSSTFYNRGSLYDDLGRLEEALADYSRAIELEPVAQFLNNRGITLQKLERHAEALADFNRAIELDPAHARAYNNRGSAHINLGYYEEALADIARAIELDPAYVMAYENMGVMLGKLARFGEARPYLEQAVQFGSQFAVGVLQNFEFLQENFAKLEQAARNGDEEARRKLAQHKQELLQNPPGPPESLSAVAVAANADAERAQQYLAQGNTLLAEQRYNDALQAFMNAIHLDPTLAEAYIKAGAINANQGHLYHALCYFKDAVRLGHRQTAANVEWIEQELAQPDRPLHDIPNIHTSPLREAMMAYLRGHYAEGLEQWEAALPHYTQAVTLDPNFGEARRERGNVLRKLNRPTEALHDLTMALQLPLFPRGKALAYLHRGNVYNTALSESEAALADFTSALQADPSYVLPYINRGNILSAQGKYKQAIKEYDQAIALSPENALAYYNRALVYSRLKRYRYAVQDYTRAIEIEPDYADAYLNRSQNYHELKRYREALADLQRFNELRPNDPNGYYNQGNLYWDMKRYDDALACFRRATEIAPRYLSVYYNWGILLKQLRRFNEALDIFAHMLAINPDHAGAPLQMGNIYNEAGDYARALYYYDLADANGNRNGASAAAELRRSLH